MKIGGKGVRRERAQSANSFIPNVHLTNMVGRSTKNRFILTNYEE